ncbi:hypothetical protein ACWY4D_004996, partial [Escherichia coli]
KKNFCQRFVRKNQYSFDKANDKKCNILIIKGKLTCQNVRTFLTKWILKKTGNFQPSFVRKYHVFCFDFCCHGFSAKHMTFSFVVFMTL